MREKWVHQVLAALLVSGGLVAGCGSSTTGGGDGDEDDGVINPDPDPNPTASFVGAAGVTVSQVNIYQGPERVLALGGAAQPANVPLVAGRDALVRVFYQAAPEQVGKTVVGRLEIVGQEVPFEVEAVVAAGSVQEQLETTINFLIPGDVIGEVFEYRVSILEDGEADNPTAHHPVEGFEGHVVEGPRNTFRVMMVPFQYNADGSGRTPDMSPEAIEAYRQRFLQLFPVSNVQVAAREPVPWNQQISPFGQGWQEVGQQLFQIRESEKPSDDWYYYALFQPTSSVAQFCSQGCLLGVTLLNDQPLDVGNPALRIALGVGFPEVSKDTAAHELGHAHGRAHAPCGGPDGIDPGFPYAGAGIGPWSWDVVGKGLVNPAGMTDIMGYCDNQWVSDYTFNALLSRGQHVNMPKWQEAPAADERVAYDVISVNGAGQAEWQQRITRETLRELPTVPVHLESKTATRDVQGHYYPYDHLPGGWLLVPAGDFEANRARFAIDGMELDATIQH